MEMKIEIRRSWNGSSVPIIVAPISKLNSNPQDTDLQCVSGSNTPNKHMFAVKVEPKIEYDAEIELDSKSDYKQEDVTFCCEHCGKLCKTSQRLRNHIEVVHKKEPTGEVAEKQLFQCYICGRHSVSSEGLKRHMWIHTGEKRCMCSKCGKQFSRPELLKRHQKIHTGEEPFICSFCGKKFVFSQHLKKHIRIHTGEKPFVCSICSRGYANAETLRKHMELHTKA